MRNKMDTTHLEPLNIISQHLSFVGEIKQKLTSKIAHTPKVGFIYLHV